MFSIKNKLNSQGFAHIGIGLLVVVIAGLSGVGYSVYKHMGSSTVNSYTTLAAFMANGTSYTEKACIASQTGTAPNYIDTVTAVISVNQQAGPKTEVVKNGQTVAGSGYNPLAYYSIDGVAPTTEDNWVTGPISTIKFNLVPTIPSAAFILGIEATLNSAIPSPGSSQTISSLNFCNVAPKKVVNGSKITTTTNPITKTITTTVVATNPATNKTTTTVTTTNPKTKKTTSTTTTSSTGSTTPSTPAPTVSLGAAPTSLLSGNTSTLTWSSTNANSCTASGAWSGSKATSGSTVTAALTVTSNYSLSCTGAGGSNVAAVTVTVTIPTTCATTPPTVSSDSTYPLQQVVNFTGSSLPSQWQDYGNEVQNPGGYVAGSHAVFVAGTGLELKGYTDSISGSVGGVTGASGDVNFNVANSGGFDVCFSMTSGNWQNVQLALISWPTDNNWNEGENDFFEGSPQYLGIFVHEIGSSPATNVYEGTWPSGLADGGIHDISARWDPVNGYRYYLDGTLVDTAPVGGLVTTPTTNHHLAMQLQDVSENSTNSESATIYWVAAYSYN